MARKIKTAGVTRSPNRDDYVELMKMGWSSIRLENYALVRYGEKIPAVTFRTYKHRHKIEVEQDSLTTRISSFNPEDILDITRIRAELTQAQRERIAIGLEQERERKTLKPTMRAELALLNQLLDSMKADQQDLGIMGKAADHHTLTVQQPEQTKQPKWTVQELVGDDPAAQRALASAMSRNLKQQAIVGSVIDDSKQ